MSEGLNLSRELIQQLLQTIATHDEAAREDMMLNLQYLCAVTGYLAADYPGPASERDELLQHLYELMKHVTESRAQQGQKAEAAPASPELPAGHSEPTSDPAVGIWKPD